MLPPERNDVADNGCSRSTPFNAGCVRAAATAGGASLIAILKSSPNATTRSFFPKPVMSRPSESHRKTKCGSCSPVSAMRVRVFDGLLHAHFHAPMVLGQLLVNLRPMQVRPQQSPIKPFARRCLKCGMTRRVCCLVFPLEGRWLVARLTLQHPGLGNEFRPIEPRALHNKLAVGR